MSLHADSINLARSSAPNRLPEVNLHRQDSAQAQRCANQKENGTSRSSKLHVLLEGVLFNSGLQIEEIAIHNCNFVFSLIF